MVKKILAGIMVCGICLCVSCGGGSSATDTDTQTADDDIILPDEDSQEVDNDSIVKTQAEQTYTGVPRISGRTDEFTVSGDTEKIATDTFTKLVWQMDTVKSTDLEDATMYCSNLQYGGFDDWALPNPHELASLVDYASQNPSAYSEVFKMSFDDPYWTEVITASADDEAWTVTFDFGMIGEEGTGAEYNFMCVRRPNAQPFMEERYKKMELSSSEFGVFDNLTGLLWLEVPVEGKILADAKSYCSDLSYGRYSDWRLPNINELRSVIDYGREQPATRFPSAVFDAPYWSATGFSKDGSQGWVVSFETGAVYTQKNTESAFALCVRTK